MTPNGCGAQGSIIDPPDLRFRDACDDHDIAYAMGGTPADRAAADREFRQAMLKKAACAPWHKRAYLVPGAWLYWAGVRIGGWRHFGKACLVLICLLGCANPPARLLGSEDASEAPEDSLALLRDLVRSLDSLKAYQDSVERANCKPPACYWDPGPPPSGP